MKKKPDTEQQFPDEAAIEERVRQMMDISVPEESQPTADVYDHKPVSIKIIHDDAPEEDAPQTEEAADLNVLPNEGKKSITITHFSDKEDAAEATLPESVEDPLIPTDKLASTIEINTPAEADSTAETSEEPEPKKTKKTKTTKSKAAKPKPAKKDQADKTIDDEIAQAFAADNEAQDHLAADNEEHEVPTAPELPGIEPDKAESEQKPKFDKFTPLTNIRPRMPEGETGHGPLRLDGDKVIDEAVDDIVVTEADRVLATPVPLPPRPMEKPATAVKAQPKPVKIKKQRHKLLKKLLLTLGLLIFVTLAGVFALPSTRMPALNAIGVRATASTTVLDQSTDQPLRGVSVTIGDKTVQTDAAGQATISGLRLGKTQVVIQRPAYAPVNFEANITDLTETLEPVKLTPTGTQFTLSLVDWLSGKPVKGKVESRFGDAIANNEGIAKLTVDKSQTEAFETTINTSGYRSEKITLDPAKADQKQEVRLVLARKHIFASRQPNSFDVYSSDLDGQDLQTILEDTGFEQPQTFVLAAAPDQSAAAVVSRRSAERTTEGTPVQTLTLIMLHDNSTIKLSDAGNIQIVGWYGEYLIFSQIAATSKKTDADRQQLISYSVRTKQAKTLAKANYFNNAVLAGGKVYYAPASAQLSPADIGFFQINPDGDGKATILSQEVWNLYRPSYDRFNLSVQQDWYGYKLGDKTANRLEAVPTVLDNPLYMESPDNQSAVWLNAQQAPAKLMFHDKRSNKAAELSSQNGVNYPVYWLNNDTLVYRVSNGQENADYVYSKSSQTAKKLRDVANVDGITSWQVR